MKQETISVLFYAPKSRTLKNGETPVILRVTISGVSDEARIQRSVPLHLWNAAKGCSRGKDRAAQELNEHIRSLTVRLLTIHREMSEAEAFITPTLLLKKLFGKEDERRTVVATFRAHNDECRALIGIDYEAVTINRYDNCARALAEVVRREFGKEDISFHELTGEFVRKFEIYLKTERHLCQNTLVRYMKCLKKFTNLALANKRMRDDPFLGKRFRQVETNPVFLTMDELETMMRKEFAIERLAVVRDVFVFCALSGLAFIDASDLRPEHLVRDNDGALWIRKPRRKTGVMSNIPLLGMARQILEKYRDHPACLAKGVCLPMYSNQKYNSYLKEIADFCGIRKPISSHTARHTFGTTVTLANNVSLQNVSKMMGHSSTKMTQHYARVLDQNIFADMQGVEARMAGLGGL